MGAMIITAEPLFKSAHAALSFAFNFSDQQWQPSAMARMMGGPPLGKGRGLVGVDGAAQAGMIKAVLGGLSDIHRSILVANTMPRYKRCDCGIPCCSGRRPMPEWEAAIDVLIRASMSAVPMTFSYYQMRRGVIRKYFGEKLSLGEIADKCGVNRNKVGEYKKPLWEWLRDNDSVATSQIEDALRDQNVVGDRL